VPELPEVEVTRRRLEHELVGNKIEQVTIRVPKLRLPLPSDLDKILKGQTVNSVRRRSKYLLLDCDNGCLIIHLGMTGYLQLLARDIPAGKHDHLDILFCNRLLRFHDPRKFGTVIWTCSDPFLHPLLAKIGPEPLGEMFDGAYLFSVSRGRTIAVKQLIMNANIVAGVGNIYASEALFSSGINPSVPSGSLGIAECIRLAEAICEVLADSIDKGSSYTVSDEMVVYHPLTLHVYGRRGKACTACGGKLESSRLGNRSTIYCPACQR
jgi:formamidopyrimidine-DNA glycosylase